MKTTEQSSHYDDLEHKSTLELLESINREDHKVPIAVGKAIPQIEAVVNHILPRMQAGGRLFYIGSGTSGRLGIVDASECPPTYGVPYGLVIGIIAGGNQAIHKAVEMAEDNTHQGWNDLLEHKIGENDSLIGITASGTTPYVLGAVRDAKNNGILTAGITCNANAPLSELVDFPIEVIVGPEFVTGSTRMKAGTAQKLTLNMISTSLMVKLGRVQGNKMVDMQLTNQKLIERGTKMIVEATGIEAETAKKLLLKHGSVRKAISAIQNK